MKLLTTITLGTLVVFACMAMTKSGDSVRCFKLSKPSSFYLDAVDDFVRIEATNGALIHDAPCPEGK